MKNLKMALMASTAVAALGWNGALAQAIVIDGDSAQSDVTAVAINAELEAFLSGTRQLSSGDTVDSGLVAGGDGSQTISVTDPTEITADQTILPGSVEALARLNQATQTLDIDTAVPVPVADYAGALSIDQDAAAPLASLDAGVAAVSLQSLVDGTVSSTLGAGDFTIDVISPSFTGDATISSTQAIADALANDAVNTVSVAGQNGAGIAVPVAIASSQVADSALAAGDTTVEATIVGSEITITTAGATPDFTGTAAVDNNVVGARAGLNAVANTLTAGNGDSLALGLGTDVATSGLDLASGDEATNVLGFTADYAIGNVQTAGATFPTTVASDVDVATLGIVLGTAATVTGGDLLVRGNEVLAESTINTAANTATVRTGGLTGASSGVASLQELTGATGTETLTATVTTAAIGISTTGADIADADADSTAVIAGNTVRAELGGNVAANELRVTSVGAQGAQDARIVGEQDVATLDAVASVVTAEMFIGEVTAGGDGLNLAAGAPATIADNTIAAMGAVNDQSNLLVLASLGSTAQDFARIDGRQNADTVDLSATIATTGGFIIDVNPDATGTGGVLTLRDNAVETAATLNTQTNTLGLTADGSVAGAELIINGGQTTAGSTVASSIQSAEVTANMNADAAATAGTMNLLNNAVTASAAVNRQANLIISTDASGYAGAQISSASSQTLSGTTVSAATVLAAVSATSTDGDVSSTLANNRIRSLATGNVSTSTISASGGAGFSFSR